MYIESLKLTNVRTFVKNELTFVHPDMEFHARRSSQPSPDGLLPRPRLPNVNLLLGDNGSGKSTVLQAIALTALGPAATDAQLPLRKYVRFPESDATGGPGSMDRAVIEASLLLHQEDGAANDRLRPLPAFIRRGELAARGETP